MEFFMPYGWPIKCLMKQTTKEWKSLESPFKTMWRCFQVSRRRPARSMGGEEKSSGQNEASWPWSSPWVTSVSAADNELNCGAEGGWREKAHSRHTFKCSISQSYLIHWPPYALVSSAQSSCPLGTGFSPSCICMPWTPKSLTQMGQYLHRAGLHTSTQCTLWILIFSRGSGDETQGLTCARQVLYHHVPGFH